MRPIIAILGVLAISASAALAVSKINPTVENLTKYKVAGYVGDFNGKYVLLKAKKKYRIVPRHTIENSDKIRPGRFVVARLTVKDIASVRKFQKSRRLPL